MVASAIGGSAVAGLAGSVISSNASKKAANKQADATDTANDQTWAMFQQYQQNEAPYMNLGTNEISALQKQLGTLQSYKPFSFNASNLDQTPGYQFTLQQGLKGVDNAAAAKGLGLSGAQLKGIDSYNTGLADQTYNQQYTNALNAYNTNYGVSSDQYNRLAALVGLGQNAAAGVGNAGLQTANQSGNYLTSGANATAAGIVGSSNALGTGLSSLGQSGLLYSLLGNTSSTGSATGISNGLGSSLTQAGLLNF